MRKGPLILAGLAAVAVVGVGAFVARSNTPPHVLDVRLPGGAIEQIHYAGATPPQVDMTANAIPVGLLDEAPATWDLAFPFAAFDRLSMDMDRQMAGLAPGLDGPWLSASAAQPLLNQAALSNAPAGAQSYSVVSTFSGGHECTKSVQVTSEGPGKAPRVVTNTSGDCHAGSATAAPTTPPNASRTQT